MDRGVEFDRVFDHEFDELPTAAQDELLAHPRLLETFGPTPGRPHFDTLNGSRHSNIKELRFRTAGGVWRVASAFDPRWRAIVPAAGEKTGAGERRFYSRLIRRADDRFDAHLDRLRGARR